MVSIEFTEEERRTLDYERFVYPDPQVQRKIEVLWLVSQGLSRAEVARLAGVSSKTVRRYVKRYKRGGIEALKKSEYRGRESELNGHAGTLKEYFEKNPPATVKQAQAAIEKLTGIRREYSQVRAFLTRLGLRRRKVATVPGHVDDAKKKNSASSWRRNSIPGSMKLRPAAEKCSLWMPAILCMALFCAICGLSFVSF
jgi:transposase